MIIIPISIQFFYALSYSSMIIFLIVLHKPNAQPTQTRINGSSWISWIYTTLDNELTTKWPTYYQRDHKVPLTIVWVVKCWLDEPAVMTQSWCEFELQQKIAPKIIRKGIRIYWRINLTYQFNWTTVNCDQNEVAAPLKPRDLMPASFIHEVLNTKAALNGIKFIWKYNKVY